MLFWPFVIVVVGVVLSIANAPPASATSASVPSAVAETFCPLIVRYALKVPGANDGPAGVAFGLGSFSERAKAAGVLTVFAGNDRYLVPFGERIVAGLHEAGDISEPIVVRFPRGVTPEFAYVSALGANGETLCPLGFVWSSKRIRTHWDGGPPFDEAKAREKIPGSPPVDAQLAAHESEPSCPPPPTSDATTIIAAAPVYPVAERQTLAEGVVGVAVLITPDSKIAAAEVYESSGNKSLDDAALQAARTSTYRAESFRCEPAFGIYIFRAAFSRR